MTFFSPDDERHASLALSLLPGVGPVAHSDRVSRYGSAVAALRAAGGAPGFAVERAEAALVRANGFGALMVARGGDGYPDPLLELPAPPPVLWLVGDPAALSRPCVAVVGTRHPTGYGERVAREISASMARAGATVVSGLALGIDAIAHQAALAAGAPTVAVLGTGIDVAYPRANLALHARIANEGLLISEELPGSTAAPGCFPKRNRILAGLCTATIVVEAGERSGALITASLALELGRTVAAVPGPVDAPQSAGSNRLLRDGAIMIADIADAVALVGLTTPVRSLPEGSSRAEHRVWDALAHGPVEMEQLTSACALPVRDCLAAVTALELAGAVECSLTGEVRRR